MSTRSPEQIERFLAETSCRFDFPAQYLGDEPNARVLDWDNATLRWCLSAPWPYHQASGNQSMPTVYAAINDQRPEHLCDRAYLPGTARDAQLLARGGIPMFGIQTKRQFADFDILGFTLAYPVLAINVVKMLQCSDIPVRWRDRNPTAPMIMAGGQACGSPEILAPVVDCWWLGEVEDEPENPGISAVGDHIAAFIEDGMWVGDRLACYAELARAYPFLYFPRFVHTCYRYEDRQPRGLGPEPSKRVTGYRSALEGMRLPLRRRIVHDFDAIAPLTAPVLLFADKMMGAGDFEVARGCPAWCSFCALTFRAKPYRQRSVETLIPVAQEIRKNMGPTFMAPFSPDFPTYTRRKELVCRLLSEVCESVKSLAVRVDDFTSDPQFLLLSVQGGTETITLGLEGGSQRMRDFVGKGVSEHDLKDAVVQGIRAGIRKFKIFMILGLPGEDDGDVIRVLRLAKDLADIRESMGQPTVRFQFSWTPLMIEANTPLQWFAPQDGSRVLADMFDELRQIKIDFKIGAKAQPDRATLFQVSQRASRDVGEAIVDVMCALATGCWGGLPRTVRDDLAASLTRHGFHNGYADCFDERGRYDMFGWEHIDHGVDVDLLWQVHRQMCEFIEQTDSYTYDDQLESTYRGNEWVERCDVRCQGTRCGACDGRDLELRRTMLTGAEPDRLIDHRDFVVLDEVSRLDRIQVQVTVPERYACVEGDPRRHLARRAAYRSQHLLSKDCRVVPKSVRFVSDSLHTRHAIMGRDYLDVTFTRRNEDAGLEEFVECLGTQMHPWLIIGAWRRHTPKAAGPRGSAGIVFFELEVDRSVSELRERVQWWNATPEISLRLPAQQSYFAPAVNTVNAHDAVDGLWLVKRGTRLLLRMLVRNNVDPHWVLAALCGCIPLSASVDHPANRIEVFLPSRRAQYEYWQLHCTHCCGPIPIGVMGDAYHPRFCPRCKDITDGVDITEKGTP